MQRVAALLLVAGGILSLSWVVAPAAPSARPAAVPATTLTAFEQTTAPLLADVTAQVASALIVSWLLWELVRGLLNFREIHPFGHHVRIGKARREEEGDHATEPAQAIAKTGNGCGNCGNCDCVVLTHRDLLVTPRWALRG